MSTHTRQTTRDETKRRVLEEFRDPVSLTQWTDARSMREEFGMGAWDREVFNWPSVIPIRSGSPPATPTSTLLTSPSSVSM